MSAQPLRRISITSREATATTAEPGNRAIRPRCFPQGDGARTAQTPGTPDVSDIKEIQLKKSRIPQSAQDARIVLAKHALIEPFDLTYRTIEDAWIIVDSSWRAKLGGSLECAVCDTELSRYRTDLCREHEGHEFLLIHHSGSRAEHHEYAIRQLRTIAGLDENYLPVPKERVPIRARLWATCYRIRP